MPLSARIRFRISVSFPVLFAALLASSTMRSHAQERSDDDPFAPGLTAAYRDAQGHTASRIDHQLSFHWAEAAPDPRLDPGEFRATWLGHLLVGVPGNHRFLIFGSGEVALKIAGREVLARQILRNEWRETPPVPLAAEYLPLELSFRRTEKEARLMVLWSGPRFGMEPIPPRFLFHQPERSPGSAFERGRLLARALRCGHCHAGEQPSPLAPALNHLGGGLSRQWLEQWLIADAQPETSAPRRMPAFGLSPTQAEAVADWLLTAGTADIVTPTPMPKKGPPPKSGKKPPSKPKPDAATGERLFLTLGCLACHTWSNLGAGGWFGGGDLTHIADKRPPAFFAAWLADPARFNRDHRMPVFALTDDERTSLSLFLAEQKAKEPRPESSARTSAERPAQGKALVEQLRCASCHRLPDVLGDRKAPEQFASRLEERSDWQHSCLDAPDLAKRRPGYRLNEGDARALRIYYANRRPPADGKPAPPDGRLLLAESNCLACHAREGTREGIPLLPPLLADKLLAVGKRYPDLAALIPALTPPALNSVGDKLTDGALSEVIARRGEPHRPYLQVRMPRFPLRDEQLQSLVHHLATEDRVPSRSPARPLDQAQRDRYALAGGRLVSGDGFGCTSCHQVGSVLPSQAPINARGPDLAQLDRRIRREWYDRWMRDPARIVPRMEMPSVQIPLAGVLDGKLDDQLAAVWHVLNLPGFEPPPPNPIRTLRHHGNDPRAEPVLVTDVLQQGDRTHLKPFLIGLANRHNVLLDLETGGLALWTVGDTARQRTKGKAWFWESAGTPLLDTVSSAPDLVLTVPGGEIHVQPRGQFVTEADAWQTEGPTIRLRYRLTFLVSGKTETLRVERTFAPLSVDKAELGSGFVQELLAGPIPAGTRLRLQILSAQLAARATRSADGRTIRLGDRFSSRIVLREPAGATFSVDRTELLLAPGERKDVRIVLHYLSEVPVDHFPPLPQPPAVALKGEPVEFGPGFVGERLPLPPEIMPTALTWRPDGRLVFTSLKGQVYEAIDTNGDGTEDRLILLADGLPAPYGAHAEADFVDVSAKYALLRIQNPKPGGRHVEAIASGWGYTQDYHDWAVGLPRNDRGDYFLGIPCQQDKRSPEAARFHGNVLRLVPRTPTADDPHRFALEPISAGHRFPMGLALDRHGELFVTDNQGNYKPFNELIHVRPGAHFGFINVIDRGQPAAADTLDHRHSASLDTQRQRHLFPGHPEGAGQPAWPRCLRSFRGTPHRLRIQHGQASAHDPPADRRPLSGSGVSAQHSAAGSGPRLPGPARLRRVAAR